MQKVLVIKACAIVLIGLFLLIPLTMISSKIDERRSYQWQARDHIARSWTSEQIILSPFLAIPYQLEITQHAGKDESGQTIEKKSLVWQQHFYLVNTIDIDANVVTELRKQGIYGIPVYSSTLVFKGSIDKQSLDASLKKLESKLGFQKFGTSYLALNLADMRGIDNVPLVSWLDQEIPFEPNSGITTLESGIHASIPSLDSDQDIQFEFTLVVRGMDSLKIVPVAKQTQLSMTSSWPHPQFDGAFLPKTRSVFDKGFEAHWEVSHFSSGAEQKLNNCENHNCSNLFDNAFGVNFIEAVDGYLQSERSLKYGILFIGLSFIAFFVFETLRGIAIHPVQYALVGFSLAIFFLLLTSLSEHISFATAYFIATFACVSLLAYYLKFVLGAWKQALLFAVSLAGLYGVLFVIVGAEDFALLMGSILIFLVLAGIMIITRHINWYQLKKA